MPLPYPTNPNLQAVPVYQPGRPIEEVARELGLPADGIIKVASNENPLGPLVKCGVRSAKCGMRNGKASDRRLVRPTLRGPLLRLEIGTRQGILPVVAG